MISYEGKGRDITQGRNMVHVMMASNKDWIVPAGVKARRFAVFDVSEEQRQNREFFGRLKQQLDDGGLAGMVHDLLTMDLGGWHPADEIPQTNALADQKERSLEPPMQFWLSLLDADSLPHYVERTGFTMTDWDWTLSKHDEVVFGEYHKAMIVNAYGEFLKEHRIGYLKATHKAVFDAGKKAFGLRSTQLRPNGKQERVWLLPPLAEARRRFEDALGFTGRFDR